jgi:hypothetical protein
VRKISTQKYDGLGSLKPCELHDIPDGYMYPIMSDLDKIASREKELHEAIAALQKEAEELAVARRVLSRFGLNGAGTQTQPDPTESSKLGPKRPDGAPSTFAMTESVLADAETAGRDGLTAKELVNAIREKFWPGLQSAQVLPVIYGFVRKGRLRKTPGGKFKRLKKPEE